MWKQMWKEHLLTSTKLRAVKSEILWSKLSQGDLLPPCRNKVMEQSSLISDISALVLGITSALAEQNKQTQNFEIAEFLNEPNVALGVIASGSVCNSITAPVSDSIARLKMLSNCSVFVTR